MVFDSGHPEVIRPTGTPPRRSRSRTRPNPPESDRVRRWPGDAPSRSPIEDDRFTVRGRSREGQTVAAPRCTGASAPNDGQRSPAPLLIARSLTQDEYLWSHRGQALSVRVVRATILNNLQSRRYFSSPIGGPGVTSGAQKPRPQGKSVHRVVPSWGHLSPVTRAWTKSAVILHAIPRFTSLLPMYFCGNLTPLSPVHPQVVDCSVDSSGTHCRDQPELTARASTTPRSAPKRCITWSITWETGKR